MVVSLIIKDFDEILGFQDTQCSDHHEITTSDQRKVVSTPEIDFSQAFEKVRTHIFMLWLFLVGHSFLSRTLVITKVTEINENQWFLGGLVKSMDFKILNVAIITRSPLQTIGRLVPLRKWTFRKRLRNFEIKIRVLSGFGRSFLTIEIASHHQSHWNQWKPMISKGFGETYASQDTQWQIDDCDDHHEVATSDYWTVGSTPKMNISQVFEKVWNTFSRSVWFW